MRDPGSQPSPDLRPGRPRITTAELLSVGTEITVGDTRDTNAGELARDLAGPTSCRAAGGASGRTDARLWKI